MELEYVFDRLPMLLYREKCGNKKYDVAQGMLNAHAKESFLSLGWEAEHVIKKRATEAHVLDFYKEFSVPGRDQPLRVGVEVEFGYKARADTDIKKFQVAHPRRKLDVGVLVNLVKVEAARADNAIAYFEATRQSLKDLTPRTIECPVLCIGLSRLDTEVVELSESVFDTYKQMTGAGSAATRAHIIRSLMQGIPIRDIRRLPVPSLTKQQPDFPRRRLAD